jgi:hypothetical protein
MMARLLCVAGLLWVAAGAWAAGDAAPATLPQLSEPPKRITGKEASTGYLFAKPAVLRGTLGEEKIQANIRPKEDIMDGIEGDYFVFGTTQKIMVVGDLSRGVFVMEESHDGKKISGRWEGTRDGDTLRGTWTSVDDTVSKPFVLTVFVDKPNVRTVSVRRSKPATAVTTAPTPVPPAAQ